MDLATARANLERLAGPTVGRAASARLLGVSQTTLDRWIGTGDVPVVPTASGRTEVPLAALLDLLDAVGTRRQAGSRRALSAELRARRDAARTARPPAERRGTGHDRAELRGLAYHRVIAERLDDALVADAFVRLQGWRAEGRIHPRYADTWERLLTGPRGELAGALRADDVDAAALRQSSPLAGMLSEHERRAVLGLPFGAAA